MLCDVIEYAKAEKEELISRGELKKAMEVAGNLLIENLPIDVVVRATGLTREQIEGIMP